MAETFPNMMKAVNIQNLNEPQHEDYTKAHHIQTIQNL